MSAQDPFHVTVSRAREALNAMGEFRREHKPSVRQQRNGHYRGSCICGWEARSPYAKPAPALREAIHHLSSVSHDYGPERAALDGVSLPRNVGADAQDQPTR